MTSVKGFLEWFERANIGALILVVSILTLVILWKFPETPIQNRTLIEGYLYGSFMTSAVLLYHKSRSR